MHNVLRMYFFQYFQKAEKNQKEQFLIFDECLLVAEDRKAPLRVLVVLMVLVAEQFLAQLLERPVVSFHHDYVSLLCDSVVN